MSGHVSGLGDTRIMPRAAETGGGGGGVAVAGCAPASFSFPCHSSHISTTYPLPSPISLSRPIHLRNHDGKSPRCSTAFMTMLYAPDYSLNHTYQRSHVGW